MNLTLNGSMINDRDIDPDLNTDLDHDILISILFQDLDIKNFKRHSILHARIKSVLNFNLSK